MDHHTIGGLRAKKVMLWKNNNRSRISSDQAQFGYSATDQE